MKTRVAVHHGMYGCDTGCCGHDVVVLDENGDEVGRAWQFDHPGWGDDKIAWARDLCARLYPDAEFDEKGCSVSDD